MGVTVLSDVILSNSVIAAGVTGKNIRANNRVVTEGGEQQINIIWSQSLREYEIGTVPLRVADWQALEAIHEITEGGAYGFLLQDPKDNTVTDGALAFDSTTSTYQLQKRYVDARSGRYKDRPITRPRSTGFVLMLNGVPMSSGAYSLNVNTGRVTIPSLPAAASLSWSGSFYVPVHFKDDVIEWDLVVAGAAEQRFVTGPTVTLIEIREYVSILGAGTGTSDPTPSDLIIDGPTPTPAPTAPTPGGPVPTRNVEYFGDSTTWGWDGSTGGDQVANTVPEQLATALGSPWAVYNEGVNGAAASELIAGTDGVHPAFSEVVTTNAHSTGWYIFNYGLNESNGSRTVADYKADLTALVNAVTAAGRRAILETPNQADRPALPDYVAAMREVAEETDTPIIDTYAYLASYMTANGLDLWDLMPDGLHPNQSTYDLKAAYVADRFEAIVGSTYTVTPGTTPTPVGNVFPTGLGGSWVLTFRDEFDGSTLDSSKWNDEIWYGDNDLGAIPHTQQNYDVTGSALRIWPYRSGGRFMARTITTDGKFYQTYGFFEARMKLPIGLGTWPAFWLFNHDGALSPEVDILEAYPGGGVDSGWGDSNLHPINFGLTVWNTAGAQAGAFKLGDVTSTVDLSADFHVYGCHWNESDGTIQFYFDGQRVGPKITFANRQRMFILLDLWYGSSSGEPVAGVTPEGPSNSLMVDYVRVWQAA